jgi:putative flippase GtrA
MTADLLMGQFIRYATVGLVSNGLLFAAYILLTTVAMGPKLAMSLLYVTGVIQTFYFNKIWSFRHCGTHAPAFIRYCASYAFGYGINLTALWVLVDHLDYPHQVVQGVMIMVLAIILFLLQKFWVFPTAPFASNDKGLTS